MIETEIGSEPQEVKYPDLTPEEIAAIAPITKKGAPDLFNFMPTRMVPLEEAKARGWPYLFQSTPCRYGHVAPRFVSNHRLCVDCIRLKKGKSTIGEKTGVSRNSAPGAGGRFGTGVTVKVEKQETVDAWEKRFLDSYAYHKEFKAACEAIKITEAQIESRLSYSPPFKKAFELLKTKVEEKRLLQPEKYEWTDEKYDKLIEVYINTGELATARDSIGVTPFEYFKEIARNHVFNDRIKEAEPLANMALEDRAYQLALAGNDKLLQKLLSVKKPEYKENIKVDMNVVEKLDDRQLNARLLRLLNKLGPPVIEIEAIDITETRAITASGAS